jgi:hypothetical protein
MLPNTLVINVTQEDIDRGEPCSTNYCPIARAIRRKVGPEAYISVGDTTAAIDRTNYRVSPRAADFIHSFDENELSVSPGTFRFRRI